MNQIDVMSEIHEVIIQQLNISPFKITREMSAVDIDGWDSLAHVQILVAIEKQFNVNFNLRDIKRLNNIGDLVDLVQLKIKNKS